MIRRTAALIGLILVAGVIGHASPANAQVSILDDYGDAPASYDAGDPPHHGILNANVPMWMGDIVLGFDPDGGAQPSVGASADDCNIPENGLLYPTIQVPVSCLPAPLSVVNDLLSDQNNFLLDDEDGINMGQMIPGQVTPVSVSTTHAGLLDAWIDWDGNGVFDVANRVFNHKVLAAGENAIAFTVPLGINGDPTYARFRFSSAGVALPTGAAADGEVEDYQIVFGQDLGDAPDDPAVATDFPTLIASNGARHVVTALKLGAVTDTEPNGIPSVGAVGDDINPVEGPDDEDGVTFLGSFVQGATAHVDVSVTGAPDAPTGAKLDAWADFNADHDWADAGEQIFTASTVQNGINHMDVPVPAGATTGSITTRWRLTLAGMATYLPPATNGFVGSAPNGEVEDHQIVIAASPTSSLDFGDAPNQYDTTLAVNGARHGTGALFLGDRVDAEPDGQPSTNALLDDNTPVAASDDEDGVIFKTSLVPGKAATISVRSSGTGFFDGWIDVNKDGDFQDTGEHVIDSKIVSACGDHDTDGSCLRRQDVNFVLPPGGVFVSGVNGTYARFRLSSGGTNAPDGFVPDGEVEDYQVDLALECGATVLNDPATGEFKLPFPLNCGQNGTFPFGLFVGQDHLNMNLNGKTISGDGIGPDKGISIGPLFGPQADDLQIFNGTVDNFGTGIEVAGHKTQIDNVDVEGNQGDGINVTGDDTHIADGSSTDNQGDGIINNGDDLEVLRTDASGNDNNGINFIGVKALVDASSVHTNGSHPAAGEGFGVRGVGDLVTVSNSNVSDNFVDGIHVTGEDGYVTGSTVDNNLGHGVLLDGGPRNRVNGNPTISENHLDGVQISGDFIQVLNNVHVDHNFGDGIHLLSGIKFLIKNNVSQRNGDDGIDIEKAARGGKVTRNILKGGNHDWAIEAHKHTRGANNDGNPCRPAALCI